MFSVCAWGYYASIPRRHSSGRLCDYTESVWAIVRLLLFFLQTYLFNSPFYWYFFVSMYSWGYRKLSGVNIVDEPTLWQAVDAIHAKGPPMIVVTSTELAQTPYLFAYTSSLTSKSLIDNYCILFRQRKCVIVLSQLIRLDRLTLWLLEGSGTASKCSHIISLVLATYSRLCYWSTSARVSFHSMMQLKRH